MIKEFNRVQRIEQELQKKIAIIFQQKINDPRIPMVSISSVKISRDLAYAKIFVTFLGIKEEYNSYNLINKIKIMNGYMAKYIRFLLSKSMLLRVIPELVFFYDHTILEVNRIMHLIKFIDKNKMF